MTADYRTVNRANWDERAPAHAASPDYGLDRFAADPTHLHPVVRFDLPRLGDLTGLRGVHLQCHIGTDTISLSRLGARMTGLDFSPAAVAEARRFAERLGDPTEFVESDVYAAADVLEAGSYDLVFTGIGALCWLPSVDRWAAVVARLLKPGGRLFIREGHPVLWSLDDAADQLVVRYPYFETAEPLVCDEGGTYVDHRRRLHPERDARVEPRPRRDRHRAAGPRAAADDAGRARQRPLGSAARPDGPRRRRRVAAHRRP